MSPWLTELEQIARELFERNSPTESWFLAAVFVLIVLVAFKLMARVLTGGHGRLLFVFIPGFLLMVLASAAVRIYWSTDWIPQLLGVLAVLLMVVLPLTGTAQNTTYLNALIIWAVTLLVSVIVLYGAETISNVVQSSTESGMRFKERRGTLTDFFGGDG